MSSRFHRSVAAAVLLSLGAAASCVGDEEVAPTCGSTPCTFEGLSAPVDVRRDGFGMLHIRARTDADAFFASGYLQAHERLFQMELTRRRALGRSAEVFGESRRNGDVLVRTLDIPRRGRENAALTAAEHPETHFLTEAWTAGVNRFVDEVTRGARPLPAGFAEQGITPERWDGSDGYAIGKLLMFGNANQIEFDILSTALARYRPEALERIPLLAPLYETFTTPVDSPAMDARTDDAPRRGGGPGPGPALPADAAARLAAFSALMAEHRPAASNNWAVDGAHTDTGRPMIAGDPHQGLSSPTLFWAHHMSTVDAGGTLDVVGWSFVGTPGIQLGHNRHLAWTATTNYPDTMDLFDVVVGADDTVQIGGETIPLVLREETVVVRDGDAETFTVREVPGRGVLFPTELLPLPLVESGHGLMVAWTGFAPTREAHAFIAFDRAATLDAFDAAVDQMEIGCFNFIAASAEGITYRSSPQVPDRGDTTSRPPAYLMLDGSDPSTAWTGAILPPEKLPRSRGSERGFIATANNDPFGFTRDGSVEGDPWYFGVYFDPGTRQTRIVQRLGQAIDDDGVMSMDEMKSIQGDVHSLLAAEIVPLVREVWSGTSESEEESALRARTDVARVVDLLADWDLEMTRGQAAPVAFTALSFFLTREAASDDLGIFFGPVADQQSMYVLKFGLLALRHPEGGAIQDGRQLTVMRALGATADWLVERFGAVDEGFTWGDFHGTRFASIAGPSLDGGWIPTDGGDGTVNVSSARFLGEGNGIDDRLESTGGAIFRMVAAIGADGVPRAELNMPRGLSGDPASPHWNDLESDWVANRYRPLLFVDSEIEESTAERMVLAP